MFQHYYQYMKTKFRNNNRTPISSSEIKQKRYVPISFQSAPTQEEVQSLRKLNAELREKQQVYIDKLIKLQEGLEKQHHEFMQLQDLYNGLFVSYKQKEEEIAQLQQHVRETDRNKQSQRKKIQIQSQRSSKQELQEKDYALCELKQKLTQKDDQIHDLNAKLQNLAGELTYYKNKDRMNDSRASLESKVIEELTEWQKKVDTEKQAKIKILYENQFLKNRNNDLQQQIKQLEGMISHKQTEIFKLREKNINLHRKSAQSRSASKSPRKTYPNKIIDSLHEENKKLKDKILEISSSKEEVSEFNTKNTQMIRTQEFFSFSKDEQELQSLPPQLQIENLININKQ